MYSTEEIQNIKSVVNKFHATDFFLPIFLGARFFY